MAHTTEQLIALGGDFNEEIHRELNRTFATLSEQCNIYGPAYSACVDTAFQALRGGKLVRPRMVLSLYHGMAPASSDNHEQVLQIAVATELLHFSFLIHDDVIDGDLHRRGKLNFIGQILSQRDPENFSHRGPDPEHLAWAQANGILMGDLFLSATHQIFARLDLPHAQRIRLLDLLEQTINDSVAGEFLDVGLSHKAITSQMSTALEMSRLKTATYTFELPLRAAAILSGLSKEDELKVGDLGKALGTAYQLQDDYLSTFGQAAEHGKDAFSDLREGKETTIISFARKTPLWPDIEVDFGKNDLSPSQGEEIKRLLEDCGAKDFSHTMIHQHLEECREAIRALHTSMPAVVLDLLLHQVDQLATRRS
ncbi:polyprenyl synthetase family protein [uncultured Corynebacterium sp.]|uniref:polyprenyl synthetase family protein n=1 Tax=uncultured Corynebacterium sp. TaxID=159447 RepID=UPI0025F0DC12|nr:polyprenyl synthetase family protein [uncultured Corynebacterium sp.]